MNEPLAVRVPQETVNDESVRLVFLHVKDGDAVVQGQPIADVETSKVVMEIEAPRDGFVRLVARLGAEVPIGAPLGYVGDVPDFQLPRSGSADGLRAPALEAQTQEARQSPPMINVSGRRTEPEIKASRFTPLARRMAEEAGLALADFPGVRLVRSQDVVARQAGEQTASRQPGMAIVPDSRPVEHPPVAVSQGVGVRWEDLTRRKRVEIRQISAGMARVLPSSVTVCIPTRGFRAAVQSSGVPGLSSSTLILFEVARLLRKYPMLNAIYDEGRIGYYEAVNIGWAIDDGSGLVAPVIREADTKSLHALAVETTALLERYVSRELGPADLSGATFTISDMSSEGVFTFAPLINQGTSAILGVGAEFFAPGTNIGMASVTLAFDHQLADGRTAGRFLTDLAERLTAHEQAMTASGIDEPTTADAFCMRCFRDAKALTKINAFLIRSEIPQGLVCSLCLGGI